MRQVIPYLDAFISYLKYCSEVDKAVKPLPPYHYKPYAIMLMWIAALLYFLPWDSGQFVSGLGQPSSIDIRCNYSSVCFDNAVCIAGKCDCKSGFQFYDDMQQASCRKCPEAHQTCDSCCYPANSTKCYNKVCICLENNDSYACSILFQRDQFKLATEICLGAATSMVVLGLVVLIVKSCLKRSNVARRDAPRGSNTSASSMTSVQLLVVERLRDRPPGYNDRRHIRIEKPPSYEDALHETETPGCADRQEPTTRQTPSRDQSEGANPGHADDTRRLQAVEEGDCAGAVGGVINPAFVATDEKDECGTLRNCPAAELHI